MSVNGWSGIDEFVAVASAGSFVGGARALGVSNTHVSRAVSHLESRLQAQLFYRTTRTVKLTDTGRVFLEHCERMIMERDEAVAIVSEFGEPQGELKITCSTALGERFIAVLARHFAFQYPKLSVAIDLSNRVIDLVSEGYDLAIRTGDLADSRLIATRVASRRLYTCATPAYLAAHGRPSTIAALDTHQCLVGTANLWHFRERNREQLYKPTGRWRCNSGYAVLEAALDDLGVCQLPDFYVRDALSRGALETILEHVAPPDEPIWAVYPQRRHLQPKVRIFIDMLKQELPGLLSCAPKPH